MTRWWITICFLCSAGCGPNHSRSFDETVLFNAGEGGYASYRIPALVVTNRGTVLAFCEGRKNSASDTGPVDILLRRTTDAGQTFDPPRVLWSDETNTCGNPCPVVDRQTGVVFLAMTHNLGSDTEKQITSGKSKSTRTVWITHTRDDGLTWTPPREITSQVKKPDWTWYATGPGIGIQLQHQGPHTGRLIIPCDHVTRAGSSNESTGNSHIIYSDDHGQTWTLGGQPPQPGFNESQAVELTDGRLMLNMRNARQGQSTPTHRGVAISHDAGQTFDPPTHDPTLIEPICQASIFRYDSAHILFSNPASQTHREKMTVRMSLDDGATWPIAREIFPGKTGYSCLTRLPDQTVGLLYEQGCNLPYERIVLARFPLGWLTAAP